MTSFFENSTTDPQYDYIENLGDGRGFTAGIVGFTSANGDLAQVVRTYCTKRRGAAICSFQKELDRLARLESAKTSGLGSKFRKLWVSTNQGDALLRETQDEVADQLYLHPARVWMEKLGLRTALGFAVLYDSIVQHGEGDDLDSLGALIAKTSKKTSPPSGGGEETVWIRTFLEIRRDDLLHPSDSETREVWAESVSRVDDLLKLLAEKNTDLRGPLHIEANDDSAEIP